MRESRLKLIARPPVAEIFDNGNLLSTFGGLAGLVNAGFRVESLDAADLASLDGPCGTASARILQKGQVVGSIGVDAEGDGAAASTAAGLMINLLEHALQRETAVADLADAMLGAYSELNLLYSLLPALASRTDVEQVGELLVNETARALASRRVSLLMLDDKRENFRVLASRGLPAEARRITIPVAGSIAGRAATEDGLLVIDDISECPELAARSRGKYERASFAVIRMPLRAQGQPLGVLTVTEREQAGEFSAHDRKLLEALSAMGASALMNCRLHAAATRQIMGTISALASAVDAKDHYTHDHSRRVAELCVATAREMGTKELGALREIELSGNLHDIGKIGIPDQILSKTERLTPEEFEVMKTHVKIGAEIVARVDGLGRVSQFIMHHHERFDGMGYPGGLSGDAIPIGSRLITVADSFDCLTSDRPYRKGGNCPDALRELRRCRGTQFDPDVVDAFCRVVEGGGGRSGV